MRPFNISFALAVALAAAVALPAWAAPRTAGRPDIAAGRAAAPKADLDGDRLFDDLEHRLARLEHGASVSVIVTLSTPATAARVRALAGRVGGFGVARRFAVIDAFAATVTRGQAEALARTQGVVSVEEDSTVHAMNDSAQRSFGVTAARAHAGLDGDGDGTAASYSPTDLVAAVIDSGIDADHLDLDDGKVLAFRDFVNGRSDPYDDNGHGTHVAATIAGDGEARADGLHAGVAPGAALVGLKVLDAAGNGSMSGVTAAIDWAVANRVAYGIEVLNLSLGTSGCSDGNDATSLAVDRAADAGLVVAVAAGNAGPGTCTIGAPGAARKALTVAAMADLGADGFSLARFSSRGPTVDGRIKPDVAAPGVGVTSAQANTTSGYVDFNGTSMATPFVAGVALLMREANPSLTPQQLKDAVTTTAVDWARGGDGRTAGSRGPDIEAGAGRLDAYAAIRAAGASISTPPATPVHLLKEGTLSGTGAQVDVRLHVVEAGFPLAATLIMPGVSAGSISSPDFDLYLYDPSGNLVAWAETVYRQEAVTYRPAATGTYTLRVRSYAGSGSWYADISGGIAPTVRVTASPSSVAIQSGTHRSGGASQLGSDDNAYYQVSSTTSSTRIVAWYGKFTGVANALSNLRVSYAGKNSRSCQQTIALWRWTDSTWVTADSRTVGTTEVLAADVVPGGVLGDYVSGATGDGDLRVRIRCSTTSGSFIAYGDLLKIAYDRPS